jgi:hypothetical protein
MANAESLAAYHRPNFQRRGGAPRFLLLSDYLIGGSQKMR